MILDDISFIRSNPHHIINKLPLQILSNGWNTQKYGIITVPVFVKKTSHSFIMGTGMRMSELRNSTLKCNLGWKIENLSFLVALSNAHNIKIIQHLATVVWGVQGCRQHAAAVCPPQLRASEPCCSHLPPAAQASCHNAGLLASGHASQECRWTLASSKDALGGRVGNCWLGRV
jgi:hypothetical protein